MLAEGKDSFFFKEYVTLCLVGATLFLEKSRILKFKSCEIDFGEVAALLGASCGLGSVWAVSYYSRPQCILVNS